MDKNLNEYIEIYKRQLEQGDIRIAYEYLRKYVMVIRTYCTNHFSDMYSFGNVNPGYMDYTYFYFFDDYLRSKKLRFGLVLNHHNMRFNYGYWDKTPNIKLNIGSFLEIRNGTKVLQLCRNTPCWK